MHSSMKSKTRVGTTGNLGHQFTLIWLKVCRRIFSHGKPQGFCGFLLCLGGGGA